jgi:glutathione peroxidase
VAPSRWSDRLQMTSPANNRADSPIYDFELKTLEGKPTTLAEYRGKVLLIVNVASQCGFTPQYTGLEALYRKYRDRGFEVLGFPCNQFGGQEPGTPSEIREFCATKYDASFPLFAKIEVNGKQADPLYEWLKSQAKGILGTEAIKWNFTKFLVDRRGQVAQRYAPNVTPDQLEADVERLLEG